MIFITLGSQKFQFNRLLVEIDKLIDSGKIKDSVFAQIGYSDYKPKKYPYKEFLDRDEFSKIMNESSIVITHGGTGAIINAIKKEKKVIAVPRLSKYGEHVDDHQKQLVNQFDKLNLIYSCIDEKDILIALDTVMNKQYKKYKSNTYKIVEDINNFLEEQYSE